MSKKFTQDVARATLLEARLAHEFALLGQRTTVLLLFQAFLFGGWGHFCMQAGRWPASGELFGTILPALGLVGAFLVWLPISGAMRMIDYLVTARASYDGPLGLPPASELRPSLWTRWAGHVSSGLLPPLFVFAWLAVLIRSQTTTDAFSTPAILAATGAAFGIYVVLWNVRTLLALKASKREAAKLANEAMKPPPSPGPIPLRPRREPNEPKKSA